MLRSRGNKTLFSEGPVIKCSVIPLDSKIEINCENMICLTRTKALLAVPEQQSNRAVQTKRNDNSLSLRS